MRIAIEIIRHGWGCICPMLFRTAVTPPGLRIDRADIIEFGGHDEAAAARKGDA
jgi:hypothetical protein